MRTLAILVAVLAAAVVVPAFCADEIKPAAPAAAPVVTNGSVTKIDLVGKVITIETKKGIEEVVAIYEETKVSKGGKVVPIAEIVVADKITVTKKGGKTESIVVEVIPVAPEAEAKPVTTKPAAEKK